MHMEGPFYEVAPPGLMKSTRHEVLVDLIVVLMAKVWICPLLGHSLPADANQVKIDGSGICDSKKTWVY